MAGWKQLLLILGMALIGFGVWAKTSPAGQAFLARHIQALQADTAATPDPSAAKSKPADTPRAGGRPPRVNTVITQTARLESNASRVTALGTAAAIHTVALTPKASGQITGLPESAGSTVTAGQIIATLDDAAEQIAYDTAQRALDDATASLARTQTLIAGKLVADTQLQAAVLAEDQARLKLRSAALDLANRSITAPIAGTLGLIRTEIGAEVTPQTVLTSIEDQSALTISFYLPERLSGQIAPGAAVSLTPVANPVQNGKGTITAIDNSIDAATGTFEVQASLPNPDNALRSGMSFTVTLDFPGTAQIALSPLSVQWGSNGAYVWRLKDSKVERVSITLIERNSETVLVAGDLAEGDEIVTEGLDGLKDGAEVQLLGAAKPDAKPAAPAGN